jgi:hypothetical protein
MGETSPARAFSEDQPPLHEADGQAPRHERESDQEREVPDVLPPLEAEERVTDELDAVEQLGSRPKTMATSIGTHPYVPVLAEIHSDSAVTSSSVSTGAADHHALQGGALEAAEGALSRRQPG